MSERYLTDLADACRKSGLRVVELPGWETNGRPGSFNPQGTHWHHTGGTADGRDYAEWMAYEGRPQDGLPAPLSQLGLGGDCTVYVQAAGRANHAGKAKACGRLPYGDGNTQRAGIEVLNDGTEGLDKREGTDAAGHRITQREAMHRLAAALHGHYGWPLENAAAHWETSVTGKWDVGDPAGIPLANVRVIDMDRFRAEVAAVMKGDEDVSAEDVWGHPLNEYDKRTKREQAPARVLLSQAQNRAGKAERHALRAHRAVEKLHRQLPQIIQDAVTAALAERDEQERAKR